MFLYRSCWATFCFSFEIPRQCAIAHLVAAKDVGNSLRMGNWRSQNL